MLEITGTVRSEQHAQEYRKGRVLGDTEEKNSKNKGN